MELKSIMSIYSLVGTFQNPIAYDLNLTKLSLNTAYLLCVKLVKQEIFLYEKHEQCLNCPYVMYNHIQNLSVHKVSSDKQYRIASKNFALLGVESTENVVCDINDTFGEFGIYKLILDHNKTCTLEVLREPVNIYLPIFTVALIYLVAFIFVFTCKYVWTDLKILKGKVKLHHVEEVDVSMSEKERVKSLDTFRGIVIALMVFVNYGAGGYYKLKHVVWYGLHLADLLYPWFLWIMGVCIPIAMRSRIKLGESMLRTFLHILKRSSTIYVLGICLDGGINIDKLRTMGILQRLALCYFVQSFICFITMRNQKEYKTQLTGPCGDIIKMKYTWLIMVVLMTLHTLITFLVPFENCPRGYFGPGGFHDNLKYDKCTAGIAGYIDRMILGHHILQSARAYDIYRANLFEAEGILGTFPALLHVCFGVQAGFTLLTYADHKFRTNRWLVWGVILTLMGGVLCNFSFNGGIIPLVRNLWTLSFVLITCGLGFLLFSLCYLIVDVTKVWNGKPFIFLGMNSIFVYAGHKLTRVTIPFTFTRNTQETHFTKLFANVTDPDSSLRILLREGNPENQRITLKRMRNTFTDYTDDLGIQILTCNHDCDKFGLLQ
ncbi:hypothetical protein Trydic_g16521 [Trypoxylus dichotomus]